MLDIQPWLTRSSILSCVDKPHNGLICPDAAYAGSVAILSEDVHAAARLIFRVICSGLCVS